MAKKGYDENVVPSDFSLSLVLVDLLPVLFFGGSCVLIGRMFGSTLFIIGALLCVAAGLCKVLWKLVVVLLQKNIKLLFMQMRITMPIGFAIIIVSLIIGRSRLSVSGILSGLCSFPSCILFALGALGMVLMVFFAAKLDSSDAKANWIEQLTNAAAQLCFFAGLLLLG